MSISIIIPCLNEGEYIQNTLRYIVSLPGDFEIVVVDGGSTDQTVSIVKEFKEAKLVTSTKGRGVQMNRGAQIATGEVLLFLHADTFLPRDAYASIVDYLKDSKNVGGSFYLKLDKDHLLLNFYSWCSKLSVDIFTYGDHGIFIRKNIFEQIGGYREIPFMEDLEIQKRLRKLGRFKKLKTAVRTSSRRFEKMGTVKQLLMDIFLLVSYKLGVCPIRLKKFYKDNG